MLQSNYRFNFANLSRKEITKYLLKFNHGRKLENGLAIPCIYHVNGNKKHTETF